MPLTLSGTNGVSGIDGTASTPSLRGSDLTGNGIVYGTDTVQIATGGTTAVTVDSSQRVGVGTTSPAAKFQVNVGTNANAAFDVNSGAPRLDFYNDAASANVFAYIQSNGLAFNTNGSESARIDSSGRLLVGTTAQSFSSGQKFEVSGGLSYFHVTTGVTTAVFGNDSTGSQSYVQFYLGNGATKTGDITTNGTTTAYNISSDYRLKENVQPMSGALAKVAQLNPVTFKWKINGSEGQGFIAHELQNVIPDCVTGEKDAVDAEGNPKYQGVDTSFLVATLTAAIQELSAKLDAATARIAALEAK